VTGGSKPARGPFSAIARIVRDAIDHERSTVEGNVNLAAVGIVAITLIAVPLLAGSSLSINEDGFTVTLGDIGGGIGWIIFTVLICLVFVGGTNYFRDRGRP
jgi:hypothetical protein